MTLNAGRTKGKGKSRGGLGRVKYIWREESMKALLQQLRARAQL
jgi:hypothetical protein